MLGDINIVILVLVVRYMHNVFTRVLWHSTYFVKSYITKVSMCHVIAKQSQKLDSFKVFTIHAKCDRVWENWSYRHNN